MGHIKRIANKILPIRVTSTADFYKFFPRTTAGKVHQYFDRRTYDRLVAFPAFEVGEVAFLGKNFKFSHAMSLIHSVEELFCDEIYSFVAKKENPYIIDCGANIGVSVAFFKQQYPKARVLAFEPDKAIFQILEDNIKHSFAYQDVVLENKAVWNKTEELTFFTEGALAGSVTTNYDNKNNKVVVQAVDLLEYLQEPVDFLKIDIEGAEVIVLRHIAEKLHLVQNLFVEYHSDREQPQQLQELLGIIANAGFRYYIKEAANLTSNPFLHKPTGSFDLQLNIFCYR